MIDTFVCSEPATNAGRLEGVNRFDVLIIGGGIAGVSVGYELAVDRTVCLLEMGDREGGEANLRAATQVQPQMLFRAIASLATPAHGRFFLRPSDAAKFLQDDKG